MNFWILVLVLFLEACGPSAVSSISESWDEASDPLRLGVATKPYLDVVPQGTLLERAWSGSYWPTFRGGISQRWQDRIIGIDHRSYLYDIPDGQDLIDMQDQDRGRLSPAEKWDIYANGARLPLTRSVRQRLLNEAASGQVPRWRGLCHGWSVASALETLPNSPITLLDRQGREIVFLPQDVSALVSQVYAQQTFPIQVFGRRCNSARPPRGEDGRILSAECRDLNPASLHLILDALVGKEFVLVADFESDDRVWNYAIISYAFSYHNFRELNDHDRYRQWRTTGTTHLVDVELRLTTPKLTAENVVPSLSVTEEHTFAYTLELDSESVIIGGEWTTENNLDFLWVVEERPQVSNDPFLDWAAVQESLLR